MGDLIRFPHTREVPRPSVAIEGLLYGPELKDLANAVRAMEALDKASRSGCASPIGTIVCFETEGGTHVGNLVKVEHAVWGFQICMRDDYDYDEPAS